MKKNGIRQMIISVLSGLLCRVVVLECYPLVPAFFAAAYMEEVKPWWLFVCTYIGMLFSMPTATMIKYLVILVVIIGIVKIVQWATDGATSNLVGGLSALATMIVSFSGSLLQVRSQPLWPVILLEGVFVCGAVILLARGIHFFLEWQWENLGKMVPVIRRRNRRLPMSGGLQESGRDARLLGYAESFAGLSKVFSNMSRQEHTYSQEEFGRFQSELTGKLCAGCDACAICWENERTPIYELLPRLVSSVLETGRVETRQKEELKRCCKRSKDMVAEAVRVFERISLNRAWYNRLLENRQTIAEQLDAMAYVMKDCAKEDTLLDEREGSKLSGILYHAKEHGILIEEIHLYETVTGHYKLQAGMRSRQGGCVAVKNFLTITERILGRRFKPVNDTRTFVGKEASEFVFIEDTRFKSVQGIARQKKDGAYVSGDNFSFLEMENGNFLMGLSDGMGSGSTACKESELVLDLVEKFLEAGFSMETAIRMMNAAMVLKGEEDLYSTVDLCNIDLYNGEASFFKIGAAASFLKRDGEVSYFASHSLPVGVGNNPEIDRHEIGLKNGDFVVMVTDGVLEYLHVPKPEETLKEIIESIDSRHPGVLVKKIMERVMLLTGGRVSDDMTILATCIWEK